MKLSNETLEALPASILRPNYNRKALTPGIVHIGVGNFHRAHLAWYVHRLMQQGIAHEWAIIGAGVRPSDAAMRKKLLAQDCMTTLIELDPVSRSAEVSGSMVDYLPVEEDNFQLIRRMTEPDIRIVSLTVTEGGYYLDAGTGGFDAAHPDIIHDSQNPENPCTAFGAIVAALRLRRDAGAGPFTCLSCDNLPGNGNTLRQTVVALAQLSDPDLAAWIEANCTFPNSMVDCIVPATGPKEFALAKSFGVDDLAPVTHENFRQWVIEDKFCAGRPDWEHLGANFSDNVHGYELQKIRILNAGHQFIVSMAELLHIETISEAMQHAGIRSFFRKVQCKEVAPHVVPVPGMTPLQYVDLIVDRFANPEIVDTVRRNSFDGTSRHSVFVLPSVRDGLILKMPVVGLALVEASWARMCAGTREDGSDIEPNDPLWEVLQMTAKAARADPMKWLSMRNVYGDLADQKTFSQPFCNWLQMIWDEGIEAAIERYCSEGCP